MLYSNKKKIRGWRRRIKQLDTWYNLRKSPDIDSFQQRGETYVKVIIDPWYRLNKRVPPAWYFKLIIGKLILIHDHWKTTFDSLQQPFDLQLWLKDPDNIESQLVCAKVDSNGERRSNYFRAGTGEANFPSHKWSCDRYNLSRFEWGRYDDEYLRFKKSEGLDDEEIEFLLKRGFKEEQTTINGNPETMYSRKAGDVWVGRLK